MVIDERDRPRQPQRARDHMLDALGEPVLEDIKATIPDCQKALQVRLPPE